MTQTAGRDSEQNLVSQFIAIPISVLQMMHIIHNVQTYAPKEKMVESS